MLNNFTNILGAIALAIAIIKVYLIVRKLLLDESNIKIKQTNSVRVKLSRSSAHQWQEWAYKNSKFYSRDGPNSQLLLDYQFYELFHSPNTISVIDDTTRYANSKTTNKIHNVEPAHFRLLHYGETPIQISPEQYYLCRARLNRDDLYDSLVLCFASTHLAERYNYARQCGAEIPPLIDNLEQRHFCWVLLRNIYGTNELDVQEIPSPNIPIVLLYEY